MDKVPNYSIKQIQRYPIYLKYLISMRNAGVVNITSPLIARALKFSEEQVKKDLQAITSTKGKPNLGRDINVLIDDIEQLLGYKNTDDAIIVGVGSIGEAFMKYEGFKEFGLNILAGFDINPQKIDTKINGKPIFAMSKLKNLVGRLNVKIAIIATPSSAAQYVADLLVDAGIQAIWNFAPINLNVSEDIVIENVNLASSLAVISHKLKSKLQEEKI